MKTKIYQVIGKTGDYEDRFEWVAKSFFNQEKASDFCEQLNHIAQKSHAKNYRTLDGDFNDNMYDKLDEVAQELSTIDPLASVSFPGTSYVIKAFDVE